MAEGWNRSRRERCHVHPFTDCPEGCNFKRPFFRSVPVCRFFVRGNCVYADNCRFRHVGPSRGGPSGTTETKVEQAASKALPDRLRASEENSSMTKINRSSRSVGKSCSAEDWVNAPEFVPSGGDWNASRSPKTYAEAVSSPSNIEEDENATCVCSLGKPTENNLGTCRQITQGMVCDVCNRSYPNDEEERKKKHVSEHNKKHKRRMEISFAIQRSKDKTCGICFEVVMEKAGWEQKFGILPNCNHCFCLTCIRKWRKAKNFDSKIIRSCPECRVSSDFVCPSPYWVDNKEEKEKLILDYKGALSSKDCKYFLKGRGKCPFGNKCFYLHAYPDGTKADVGPPICQRRQNADEEIEVFQYLFLSDFLEERENRWAYNIEDLDDVFAFYSDSDDSDWSDYDFFL